MRAAGERRVARALRLAPSRLTPRQKDAFERMAPVLDLIPDLPRWPRAERDAVAAVVLARAGAFERGYLRLLQRHGRLRDALIRLGST